jgi:hypothetical protein
MEQSALEALSWCGALTLNERVTALRNYPDKRRYIRGDRDLAERRLKRWRSQTPLGNDAYFAQCLGSHGLSEEEFLSCLGEPLEGVQRAANDSLHWSADLTRSFSRHAPSSAVRTPEELRAKEAAGFLDAIAPLIQSGLERVEEGVEALLEDYPDAPFSRGQANGILLGGLPAELLMMLTPTMVLELHVSRLEEQLEGNTKEERFRSFLDRLRRPEIALTLLQEYPVLARQLVIRIEHWVKFSLEFLRHLATDWDAIRATFSGEGNPGVLVGLTGGAGDSHRGGLSVRIARFSSGLQLVYKPRAVGVEAHFQGLLQWLNEHGNQPAFRTLTILDRDDHGWIEFVEAATCKVTQEVHRFYERQGAFLALLYLLEATDFHFENVIAAGWV